MDKKKSKNRLHFRGRRVIFRWIFRNAHESGCFLFGQTDAVDRAISEPECTGQGQSRTIRTVGRWKAAGGPCTLIQSAPYAQHSTAQHSTAQITQSSSSKARRTVPSQKHFPQAAPSTFPDSIPHKSSFLYASCADLPAPGGFFVLTFPDFELKST